MASSGDLYSGAPIICRTLWVTSSVRFWPVADMVGISTSVSVYP